MAKKDNNYSADSISVLEGLEPVRKRPGMYIGSTGPDGLHTMVREIFDNSRDEAMGGYADRVEVAILPNEVIRVVDNGRGIPVDKHKQSGVSALETIMTTLHAGGKFGGEESGYKISGGLHGVGASVVNALSEYTKAEVHKDGHVYVQEYAKGIKTSEVKKQKRKTENQGTIISFRFDPEIFKEQKEYSYKRLKTHLRGQAYLVKGLRITILDLRDFEGEIPEDEFYLDDLSLPVPAETFYFDSGLLALVRFLNKNQKAIHKNIFYTRKELDTNGEAVEVAFQYVDDISNRIFAYANNIPNPEGGFHLTGFKTALTRVINSYARKNNILKEKDDSLTGDDLLEGITAVVSVHLADPQFEGQTKGKLGSTEAKGMVETAFSEALNEFLEEKPDDGKQIIRKAVLAQNARKAAKAAKDSVMRKGALEGLSLPGKLADCQSKKAEDSELFIVEGDSAGGSAKMGRDRKTQAILPLKGKILNVERARIDKILGSQEVRNVVTALGTGIGDIFDIEKLRYHKIIIATDADVDGEHITTLLMTLFYRYFRPLIENGNLYLANPPLYKIQKGKEIFYAFNDDEKFEILKTLGVEDDQQEDSEAEESDDKKKNTKVKISRYKGLGEMDPPELYETTMDKDKRILKQITIDDAAAADEIFDILMGSEVPPRKSFIVANAKMANLDI
ncbi:DNA topoisomerase IV subunit B [Candidatus Campbellbacteria bacterium]|nr:MAG: DNA topoisomerase IV subunit B [Candidatus Campbellbacteria bacterium]